MNWRCKHCGFIIKDREDRRTVKIEKDKVYIIGYCDNCLNWSILDSLSKDLVREYAHRMINDNLVY